MANACFSPSCSHCYISVFIMSPVMETIWSTSSFQRWRCAGKQWLVRRDERHFTAKERSKMPCQVVFWGKWFFMIFKTQLQFNKCCVSDEGAYLKGCQNGDQARNSIEASTVAAAWEEWSKMTEHCGPPGEVACRLPCQCCLIISWGGRGVFV